MEGEGLRVCYAWSYHNNTKEAKETAEQQQQWTTSGSPNVSSAASSSLPSLTESFGNAALGSTNAQLRSRSVSAFNVLISFSPQAYSLVCSTRSLLVPVPPQLGYRPVLTRGSTLFCPYYLPVYPRSSHCLVGMPSLFPYLVRFALHHSGAPCRSCIRSVVAFVSEVAFHLHPSRAHLNFSPLFGSKRPLGNIPHRERPPRYATIATVLVYHMHRAQLHASRDIRGILDIGNTLL
eukprot:COSAG02_NODE_8115_length_2703_cov_13.824117_3_plen_235_part_00